MRLSKSPLKIRLLSLCLLSVSSVCFADDKAALVSIKQAKQKEVTPTTWLSGNVVSRQNARISAEQSGRLTWMLDIGDKVNEGEPIARLDATDLNLQLEESGARARSQVANIDYLKKQKSRLTALINNNSTARIELDGIERDLKVAQEELMVLKTRIQQIELAISKATIVAPFEGLINRREAQPGEYVGVGSTLVQLVNPVNIDISVAAPLSIAPYLKQGAPVMVKWADRLEMVRIRTWSPVGEQSTRTFNLRLDATRMALLAGSGVSVSLPSAIARESTLVPRDALVLRDKETFVMKVDQENIARKVSVLLGQGVGDWISVSGQVSVGDNVIVRGGERLQAGQKVRIANQNSNDDSSSLAIN